jgi:hypothetical protein
LTRFAGGIVCATLHDDFVQAIQLPGTRRPLPLLAWRRRDRLGAWPRAALDGTEQHASVYYAYRFDTAAASRDGRFAVIYERLGTKGLVLKDGEILREIDRSFYQADAYEYPVALFHEPGGRLLLAHCPRDYRRIELEDAETGQSLTASDERQPSDFFHSRLAASPRGKRLLSAGWVWHPVDVVASFDVARAIADPHHLDRGDKMPQLGAEVASACWLDDDCIVVGSSAEPIGPEGLGEPDDEARMAGPARLPPQAAFLSERLPPLTGGLAVYDLARGQCLHRLQLSEEPGTIVPIGRHHVLSLYRHPKLIDLSSAQVLYVWTELDSGLQNSSIMLNNDAKPPPMAFDPVRGRFAIAASDRITVIEFDLSPL